MTVTSLPEDILKCDTIYYIDSLHNSYPDEPTTSSSRMDNILDIKETPPTNDDFPQFLPTLNILRVPATWTPSHTCSNVASSSSGPSNPSKSSQK